MPASLSTRTSAPQSTVSTSAAPNDNVVRPPSAPTVPPRSPAPQPTAQPQPNPNPACSVVLGQKAVELRARVADGLSQLHAFVALGTASSHRELFQTVTDDTRALGKLEGALAGCDTPTSYNLTELKKLRVQALTTLAHHEVGLQQAWLDRNFQQWFRSLDSVKAAHAYVGRLDVWIAGAKAAGQTANPQVEAEETAAEAALPTEFPEQAAAAAFKKKAWMVGGLAAVAGVSLAWWLLKNRRQ